MPETPPPRQPMNFLRLGFALLLWPGLVATLLFFGKLFRNITQTPGFPWAGVLIFSMGFILACIAFFALPRPRGIYVLGHELTHALAVWISGGKVHSLQASSKGGKVLSDRVSPWISLAPYIFPFYPMIAGILWLAGTRIWPELQQFPLPLLGLWGAIWGYHYAFTFDLFPTRQPDFLIYGRVFSLTLILLGNTFLIGGLLWSTFRPSPLSDTMLHLGSDWAWTYTSIAHWVTGLLLRYLPHSA